MSNEVQKISKKQELVLAVNEIVGSIDKWHNDTIYKEKFKEAVYFQFKKNPKILTCSTESIILALKTMMQFKLLCNAKNECALIPYGSELTFQAMVAGIRKIAYESGVVKRIISDVIYEGDLFENEIVSGKIIHSRRFSSENVIGAYALVETANNGNFVDIMTKKDIENTRKKSKNNALWSDFFHEKCKITVTKRLLKTLTDLQGLENLQEIIQIDNDAQKNEFSQEKDTSKADMLNDLVFGSETKEIEQQEEVLENI